MKKKEIKFIFIWIFAVVPLFCLILDIAGTEFKGVLENGSYVKYNLDSVIAEQTIYFSVWTSLTTCIWGITNIINYFKKENKIKWGESENVLTMIFTFNFVSAIIYSFTIVVSRDTVPGFNTWFNIIKSVLEHWIVPLVLAFYYFLLREKKKTDVAFFMKKKAWMNLIIPLFYAFYISIRCVLINELSTNEQMSQIIRAFPYSQFDPYKNKETTSAWLRGFVTFICMFSALVAIYSFSVLFEFLSVRVSIKFENKFFVNDSFKFRKNLS